MNVNSRRLAVVIGDGLCEVEVLHELTSMLTEHDIHWHMSATRTTTHEGRVQVLMPDG